MKSVVKRGNSSWAAPSGRAPLMDRAYLPKVLLSRGFSLAVRDGQQTAVLPRMA
jgi:hypothetical protein